MNQHCCPVCSSDKIHFSLRACLSPENEREIVGCTSCESFFYFPLPSESEIQRCYTNSYYADFFANYWNEFYKGRRYAKLLSQWKNKGKFLDTGSSIGTMLYGIKSYSEWEVFGLEISGTAVEMAERAYGLRLFQGDIFHSPWQDETFDYILANNVLEHTPDPVNFLKRAVSLLKTGGRLEVICPNGKVDLAPNKILFEKKGIALPTAHSGHLFFFSRKALLKMFSECGLRVIAFLNFHFKTAWKARGWFPPGAFLRFQKRAQEISKHKGEEERSLQLKIPPKNRSWLIYRLKSAFQIFLPGVSWGYDFKILCEKQ